MKKLISIFMLAIMLVGTSSSAYAAPTVVERDSSRVKGIQDLYSQKAQLLNNKVVDQGQIAAINQKLQALGVEFLTQSQVDSKLSQNKTSLAGNELIAPMIAVPSQSNVIWSTFRSEVTSNGQSYDVQRLVAEANSSNSNLKSTGTVVVRQSYNWKAGFMELIKTAASEAIGQIPIASTVLSVYDGIKNFMTGISRETVIEGSAVTYTWSQNTIVEFLYVKKKGEPDSKQVMTYICTAAKLYVMYQYPTFVYNTAAGGKVDGPSGVQGNSGTISIYPTGYDSAFNAVDSYLSPYAQKRSTVNSITVTGLEGKSVATISPVSPQLPAQIG